MKESKLQQDCIGYLKSEKIYYVNVHGSSWTGKGTPDIICCVNGLFVAFELKVGDNVMQPDQIIRKKQIERSEGKHYCPRSISEFIEIIERLKVVNEVYNT